MGPGGEGTGNGIRHLSLPVPGTSNLKPLFLASRMGKALSINVETSEIEHNA